MTSVLVRGLDDGVKEAIAERARRNGRSMEAELRVIITEAAQLPNLGVALMEAVQGLGGVELPIPERNEQARFVEFE